MSGHLTWISTFLSSSELLAGYFMLVGVQWRPVGQRGSTHRPLLGVPTTGIRVDWGLFWSPCLWKL